MFRLRTTDKIEPVGEFFWVKWFRTVRNISGSGDAATMAFNQAITVHASELGFEQSKLGMAAAISGALGRSSSPIAGAAIVCAGLAMVSPVEIAKRTAPAMAIAVCVMPAPQG